MNNKRVRSFLLSMLIATCPFIHADDFRVPLSPLPATHDFDPKEDEGWRFKLSNTYFVTDAHRAYMVHGTTTKHLSALLFNDDEFRMSKIFQNCLVEQGTKYYNPYMRVIKIAPRVRYHEEGVHLSCSIDREVFRDKGRIGMRLHVPFKTVRMERLDTTGRRDSQTEDVFTTRMNPAARSGTNPGLAVRWDYLEALPDTRLTESFLKYRSTGGLALSDGTAANLGKKTVSGITRLRGAAVISDEGYTPDSVDIAIQESKTLSSTLPAGLGTLTSGSLYDFSTTDVYAALQDENAASVEVRVANQDKKARVWLISTHKSTSPADSGYSDQDSFSTNIGLLRSIVPSYNANTYEWLHDRGYDFETSTQVGIGDVCLDVYYEHALTDAFRVEVNGGVRIPVAPGTDYSFNPYQAHIGNGEHFEVRGGVRAGWEMSRLLAFEIDGYYAFALPGVETRCATPAGSLIKNIGPAQEADVSWNYGVLNADIHIAHPRTNDMSLSVGYQLYYKDQDKIVFKNASMESWLGKKYDATEADYITANTITIDSKLTSVNTERYGHSAKTHMTYHISDWFSITCGGSFTFAGKNCPKSTSMYGSCSVTF